MIILDNQARQQMTRHFQLSLQCNNSLIMGFVRHTAKKKKNWQLTQTCTFTSPPTTTTGLSEVSSKLEVESDRICETEDLEAEEDHLRLTFWKNGYPEKFIASAMIPRTKQKVLHADGTVTKYPTPEGRLYAYYRMKRGLQIT